MWHEKPGLCTQNTPIHATVHISFNVYDFKDLYKLHKVPYEKVHK